VIPIDPLSDAEFIVTENPARHDPLSGTPAYLTTRSPRNVAGTPLHTCHPGPARAGCGDDGSVVVIADAALRRASMAASIACQHGSPIGIASTAA